MPRPVALPALLAVLAGAPLNALPAEVPLLDYRAPVPENWSAGRPSSSMRLLQYAVPGTGGEAQFIVYYFGPGQGGSANANIARWQSQFSSADGSPVEPVTETFLVSGWPVTLARFEGSYARGIGSGPQGRALPGQMLMAAVIETPRGAVIAQLFGDAATVRQNEARFRGFVTGFRPR